ncbi:MAG: acetylglutamate kinase [Bacteroidia bacterium]|nr:acetylglutamate kinase [Bacteroidia bacterium]
MTLELTVYKIGGEVLDHPDTLTQLLEDMATVSGAKVLVHGGGKIGTEMARRLGVETAMVGGRRITSPEMLEVALMVYGGLINRRLVAQLQALSCPALGLTGADMDVIRARRRPPGEIDYGLAGDVTGVNTERLGMLLDQGIMPVLAPLTHDGAGQLLNTNADTIAAETAIALSRRYQVRLVFCFDKTGVLLDLNRPESLVTYLDRPLFDDMRHTGVIAGGMIPKLENAFSAIQAGVTEVLICHASAAGKAGTPAFIGTVIR